MTTTPPEILAKLEMVAIREERNRLLAESDWTQFTDSPLTSEQKAEWATYRQALRDITTQASVHDDVVWPTKPA